MLRGFQRYVRVHDLLRNYESQGQMIDLMAMANIMVVVMATLMTLAMAIEPTASVLLTSK